MITYRFALNFRILLFFILNVAEQRKELTFQYIFQSIDRINSMLNLNRFLIGDLLKIFPASCKDVSEVIVALNSCFDIRI